MPKKITITEEQYNLVKEAIEVNADLGAANGDIAQAVKTAYQEAERQGLKDYTVSVPAKNAENSSRLITKKDLIENRLKKLKANSLLFTVNDFIKK